MLPKSFFMIIHITVILFIAEILNTDMINNSDKTFNYLNTGDVP